MSKLDELIAEGDRLTGDEWTDSTWATRALAELRRLQARDRRYEELVSELERNAPFVMPARGDTYREIAKCIRAIREET